MRTVPRHDIDEEWARNQLIAVSRGVNTFVGYVGKEPSALDTVLQWALTSFQYHTVIDPAAAEATTWRALRLAAQAASGIFVATEAPDGEVPHDIDGPVRLPATGPTSRANGGTWLTAAWLAVSLRDDAMVSRLCAISMDTLRASDVNHSDYMYPWVESVQTFLRRERVPPEMFIPAMDGTDPDTAPNTPRAAMLQLIYPPVKMFYYVLRRDGDRFNEALEQALTLHREYWTSAGRADDADGFVALAPLAISILATRVGMTVDVASEYLPANLLRGTEPEAS